MSQGDASTAAASPAGSFSTDEGGSIQYGFGITKFGNHSLVWRPGADPERVFTFIRKQTRFNKTANEHYMYYVCQDCRLMRDKEVKERPDCPSWSAPRITISKNNRVIRSPEESLPDHRCPRKTIDSVKGVESVTMIDVSHQRGCTPSTPSSTASSTPPPQPHSPQAAAAVAAALAKCELVRPVKRRPKRKLDQWANDIIKKRVEQLPLRTLYPTYEQLLDFTVKLVRTQQPPKPVVHNNNNNHHSSNGGNNNNSVASLLPLLTALAEVSAMGQLNGLDSVFRIKDEPENQKIVI